MPIEVKKNSLNIKGQLFEWDNPLVMGILNVTPDSFYEQSRTTGEKEICERLGRMLREGAEIIDVGGCSTRPGYQPPLPEEELRRIELGCNLVKEMASGVILSVDTFRGEVAKFAIENFGVDIINDVSGGTDPLLLETVAYHKIPYVLTHNRQDNYADIYAYEDVTAEVITELSQKLDLLHRMGINDVIIDPGFGFAKTIPQNFKLLSELEEVTRMGYPILVGISRKSFIYKELEVTPEESLAGTIALDAMALLKGADILRVHDVLPAVSTVKLYSKIKP